ncbi:unnamed protein product [Ceutorhynchus assimilis]|uniref:LITAF domain-containing protein n=1 Tax=Ceutorhynchus assimilis TaxID=467358 RepID=A0A9N9MW51_9CUCU|nr:unnamed protein product [Ceutorhynchus assimilis]
MKNDEEDERQIPKSNSSTSSEVLEIENTDHAVDSVEPNLLISSASNSKISDLTVNENDIVTTGPPANTSESVLEEIIQSIERPTTSSELLSQHSFHERRSLVLELRRNLGSGGLVNSNTAMHHENHIRKGSHSTKTSSKILPSYSSVLKLGPPISEFESYPSLPYISRQPPPSYAEVSGWEENPSIASAESFTLGPNPIYISCPRCRTIVITNVQTERSNLAYILSVVMCICLCWPCCLAPFCFKSCKNSYHFCPSCNYFLGAYKPC